jgi:hypothetical protein
MCAPIFFVALKKKWNVTIGKSGTTSAGPAPDTIKLFSEIKGIGFKKIP